MIKSRRVLVFGFLAAASITGCGGGGGDPGNAGVPPLPTAQLVTNDLQAIISQAVTQAVHDRVDAVVAVSDREGNVLGVWDMKSLAQTVSPDGDAVNAPGGNTRELIAIEKARTAAFLSSDQNAFSTTTGLFIVQKHFPPGVGNSEQGPLFQLTMSQLPCSDVRPLSSGSEATSCVFATTIGSANPSCFNGITGNPGGIPLYKNGAIAGGIGIDATGGEEDEVIALAGASGIYAPPSSITADNLFVGGIQLAWTNTPPPPVLRVIPFGSLPGNLDPNFTLNETPAVPYPGEAFAGVTGELRFPAIDGASVTAPDGKSVNLTVNDVNTIITQSVALAARTRAAIRQPVGVPARMQVGITDTTGAIIGEFRMNDATGFSFDIVIQKGRSVTAFSDPGQALGQTVRGILGVSPSRPIAFTTRTLEFIAEPLYPPGIDANPPGPLNNIQLQLYQSAPGAPNCSPYSPGDGVCLFPGSIPLYKDGALVGGLGISGDGVDQDDFVTNGGAQGYLPPAGITADHVTFRGTPLPYLKFPRHPLLE